MSRIPTEGATASISRTYLTKRVRPGSDRLLCGAGGCETHSPVAGQIGRGVKANRAVTLQTTIKAYSTPITLGRTRQLIAAPAALLRAVGCL
jgi:hypothetical protein